MNNSNAPGDVLRECPFCGPGESVVEPWFDDAAKRWRVGCGRCGCSTGTHPRDTTKEPAIAAWNTRAVGGEAVGAAPGGVDSVAKALDGMRRCAKYGKPIGCETVLAWAGEVEAGCAALQQQNESLAARLQAAEARVEALKEVGPVLSECRWLLVDMHIWPPETTVAMSVDLLPRVDAVIEKAHAALGHPASTTGDAALHGQQEGGK